MSIDPSTTGLGPLGPAPIALTPGVQGDLRTATEETPAADQEFSFWDFLDVINPLQHIPVVSTIYREITGDTMGNVARIAGDALYGGPLGLLIGFADSAISESSGKDIGEHILAMFTEDGDVPEGITVAAAEVDAAAAPVLAMATPAATAPAITPNSEEAPVATQVPTPATGRPVPALGPETRWFAVPQRGQVSVRAPAPADAVAQARSPDQINPQQAAQAAQAMMQGAGSNLSPALMAQQQISPVGEPLVKLVPPPEMVRQRLVAQGLQPGTATQPVTTAASATPQGAAPALPTNAPIEVPAWFDGAMKKAMNAYEKTGRLSGATATPVLSAGGSY